MILEEIEFRCANSLYPHYRQLLSKHRALHQRLQRDGLLPYRQNFSSDSDKQYALAVVVLDPTMKGYALQQAEEIGLPVDTTSTASDRKIQEILRGEYDYQMVHKDRSATARRVKKKARGRLKSELVQMKETR